MKPAVLEKFDNRNSWANFNEVGPTVDWVAGYAEGEKSGRRLAEKTACQLSEDLVQRLQDISFGHAEAKANVLQQLGPLFCALSEIFIPTIAKSALVPFVHSALTEQALEVLEEPLKLALSPGQIDAVDDVLRDQISFPFQTRLDSRLADGEAIISAPLGEVMIDLAGVSDQVVKVLATFSFELSESPVHG